jgi:hypothetical protein
MADFSFTSGHKAQGGYNNTGTLTWAHDTTGDTVLIVAIFYYSATAGNLSGVTYNGVAMTSVAGPNTASSHLAANLFEVFYINLGANAGAHSVIVTWTGGGFINGISASYTGDVDPGVLDGTPTDDSSEKQTGGSGVAFTESYTTTTDKAWVIQVCLNSNHGGVLTPGTGAALRQSGHTDTDLSFSIVDHNTVTTPAGATSLASSYPADVFVKSMLFALKPLGAGTPVTGTTIASGAAVNVPLVAVGAVTILAATIASGAVVNAPVATPPASAIAGATIASGTTVNVPSVSRVGTMTLAGTTTKYEGGTILPYQRDADNSTDVAMSGTWSADTAPTGINANRNSAGNVALTNVVITGTTSGNWSGTLAAQAGGEGSLVMSLNNSPGTTVTTYLALGDYFLIIGDSVAAQSSTGNQTALVTTKHTRYLHNPGEVWVEWDSTPDVGGYPFMGDEITTQEGVPVGFINSGFSGTSFSHWRSGQTYFDDAMAAVALAKLNAVRAVLVFLGANNAKGSGNTAASVKTAIEATCTDINANLTGGAKPIFWSHIAEIDSSTGTLRTEVDAVRQGLINAVADGACYFGANLVDLDFTGDNLHPDANDAIPLGRRLFLAVTDTLYGTSYGRGPRISHVSTNGAKDTFIVTFDRTLGNTVTSAVTGMRAESGDGTALTISSATVTASTQVTIVTTAGATGTPQVSFASGNDAVGSTPPRTATETLPSGATLTRPAEVFLDYAADLTQLMTTTTIASGAVVNAATVTRGAVTLTMPTITSGAVLLRPTVHRAGDPQPATGGTSSWGVAVLSGF